MSEIEALSRLFAAAEAGDPAANERLFTLLYAQLHDLARRELRRAGGHLTMGPRTLLHETWLKLSRRGEQLRFPDEHRFMAYAARAMRGLVIDYARRRQAFKRGAEFAFTARIDDVAADTHEVTGLEALDRALDVLAKDDPALAELVDLKYFVGLSFAEIATVRGVTERTVYRHWEKARIYLLRELTAGGDAAAFALDG